MSFANPTYDSRANAPGYIDALLGLLGERDPWSVQQSLVANVRDLLNGLNEEQINTPELPGKWSIAAVAQHLVDTEIVYGYRMRLIIGADKPMIEGYDQDDWARELRYDDARVEPALVELDAIRNANLRMLKGLTDEQWERYGVHSERGQESVRRVFALIAGHDLVHLAQIDRIRKSVSTEV